MATFNDCVFGKMSLCIITPNLPPAIDGIGDYCRMFREHWSEDNIPGLEPSFRELSFLIPDERAPARVDLPAARVGRFQHDASSLLSALHADGSQRVLLQYSGYGFDDNGVPEWMCDALERWVSENNQHQLFINFHENWAAGPPWKKVFWLQRSQIRCAHRLLGASRAAATSNQAILKQLRQLDSKKNISLIPIGLTLHLPQQLPAQDFKRYVALGREGARLRGIRLHLPLLSRLHAQGLIDELVLGGEQASKEDQALLMLKQKVPGLKVTCAYNFADADIPESVLSAGVALMHTETACILKSTAFHLAVSCGQVPVAIFNGASDPPVDCSRHLLTYKAHHLGDVAEAFGPANLQRLKANLPEILASTGWGPIVKQWYLLTTGAPLRV